MRMRKLGRMIRRRYLTASVFLGAFLIVSAIDAIRSQLWHEPMPELTM